jgi:nucleotide-binding universal stress UspA family protein
MMRVLVATDGSDDAKAAVAWLSRLPLPESVRVGIVTAFELPPSPLDIPTVRAYYRAVREEASRVAGDARAVLAPRWADTETRVFEGDAREVIVDEAAKWEPDLVVVGARGLGTVTGALLGSVSSAVVHHVHCPVLVVKGRPTAFRRVVVGVDGSEHALAAARFLASLPLPAGLRVRLLAVAQRPVAPFGPAAILGTTVAAIDGIVEEHRRRLEGVLARVKGEFRDGVEVECSVVDGRPADEIVHAAAEPAVDLVAVGARGLGRIERLVLGSVSEHVLHRVDCSVLVVKSR